jgi:hypothetical protein
MREAQQTAIATAALRMPKKAIMTAPVQIGTKYYS